MPAAADSHTSADHSSWNVISGDFNPSESMYASGGSFYLTKDVKFTGDSYWDIEAGETLNLCLNGSILNLSGKTIYVNGGTFNLYDCNTTTRTLDIIWQGTPETVSFIGGAITGGRGYATDDESDGVNGGAVYIGGGTFTMYGGNLINNTAGSGGAVSVSSGTFNMHGGNITKNTAYKDDMNNGSGGGVVVLNDGMVFNMTGGSIIDNHADNYGYGIEMGARSTFNVSSSSKIDDVWLGSDTISEDSRIFYAFINVTGDFTGEITGITGSDKSITNGNKIIRITTESITASQILNRFSLDNTHTQFKLINTDNDKNISIVYKLLEVESASITPYNSTVANVTFTISDEIQATKVSVTLTNTSDSSDVHTYEHGTMAAGATLENVQITGLNPNSIYKLTIAPENDAIEETNVYTHSPDYTSPAVLAIKDTTPPEGMVGESYSFTFEKETGEGSIIWSADTTPAGLSLNENTGEISGKPTEAGQTTIIITATSDREETASKQCTIIIQPAPLPPSPESKGSSTWIRGEPYSLYTVTLQNGGVANFNDDTFYQVVMTAGYVGDVTLTTKSDTDDFGLNLHKKVDIAINKPIPSGGVAIIKCKIFLADVQAQGFDAADVSIYHFENGAWVKLATTYSVTDGIVYTEAKTQTFSPFALGFEKGGATVPTGIPDVNPSEEAKSPLSVVGILAGLGFVVAVKRRG